MRRSTVVRVARLGLAAAALLVAGGALFGVAASSQPTRVSSTAKADRTGVRMMDQGRRIFRNDTFGDESFWSGVLQLERAIEGAKHGGVGGGLSPKAALAAGLKVDSAALPKAVVKAIKAGKVDLNDP